MLLQPVQVGIVNEAQIAKVEAAVVRFTKWLDRFGETSYDHQSYFASNLTRGAKALYYTKSLVVRPAAR